MTLAYNPPAANLIETKPTVAIKANFLPKGFLRYMAIALDQKSNAIRNTIPKTTIAVGTCSGCLKFLAMIHGEPINPKVKDQCKNDQVEELHLPEGVQESGGLH